MNKIDLIIDTIHELMYSNSTAVAMQKYYAALAAAKELREELTKLEERVCCGDYEKCTKPCTPKGEWLAKKELAKTEQAEYDKLTVKFGERAKEYLENAKKSWEQEPVAWRNAAIRLGEDLYSVGPNGYYEMTAKQWLDWALSVVNTTPSRKEWVGLTDDELMVIEDCNRGFWINAAKIEQLLKDKNT